MFPMFIYQVLNFEPIEKFQDKQLCAQFLNHLPDSPYEFEIHQLSNICMLGAAGYTHTMPSKWKT